MANEIFREPLRIERIVARQPIVWQVPNLLTAELSPSARPFSQTEWPNPVRRTWAVSTTHWRPADLAPPNTKPNLQADWPNPVLRRQDVSNLWWESALPTGNLASVQAVPFTPADLGNPIRPMRMVVPYHHREVGPSPVVTVVTNPFTPVDFPNPIPKSPFHHRTISRSLINVVEDNPAALLVEWPNPVRRVPPLQEVLHTPVENVLYTAPNTKPFTMTDWTNPVLRRRSIDPLFWSVPILNNTLALSNTKPFMQSDWPNPLPKRYPQQRDFDLNAIFIVAPPPPKLLNMRKTLAAMGTRVMERTQHKAGNV